MTRCLQSREIGQLPSLRFLNVMNNKLINIPDELCQLTNLYRLGLKSNRLTQLPAALGNLSSLVELFLTDNKLTQLPESIGRCHKLVKLQARYKPVYIAAEGACCLHVYGWRPSARTSHSVICLQASRNQLTSLPASLGQLPSLELLRVAVNDLPELPLPVFRAPKLAWVSLSGNPLCPAAPAPAHEIAGITLQDLEIGAKLGDGASGDVFQVTWQGAPYALKQFKADDASPDGQASDEIAVQLYVDHVALTRVVARVRSPEALVMQLVSGVPMAEKPNLQSLLRCRWPAGASYKLRCAGLARPVVACCSA